MTKTFDTSLADSQATPVRPLAPEHFNINAYAEYVLELQERCRHFREAESGVLVYRRLRVGEVFSAGCRDMHQSLNWQLGGLQKSLMFKSDIPNFLEPWYGIGTIASAYGLDYHWSPKQAPAVTGGFGSIFDALDFETQPVEKTAIGSHTLHMIEYFLEKTKALIPISLTDTQSPLNVAVNLIDTTGFMMELVLHPEKVRLLLDQIADLMIDFNRKQLDLIKPVSVWPGHGFPSSSEFKGIGMSDDNMLMISGQHYLDICGPATVKTGNTFGGPAFHSCGNWSDRIAYVKQLTNLTMVDAAFSPETDPDPNPAESFLAFAGTGIVVNARIVGNVNTVTQTVKKLWQPGMKLIITTYCETPAEQAMAYDQIYQICR